MLIESPGGASCEVAVDIGFVRPGSQLVCSTELSFIVASNDKKRILKIEESPLP